MLCNVLDIAELLNIRRHAVFRDEDLGQDWRGFVGKGKALQDSLLSLSLTPLPVELRW